MKIFIHIGAPRTATSSLQALCHANRKALAGQHIDYPKIGYLDAKFGDAQHNLAFSLMPAYPEFVPDEDRVEPRVIWDKFSEYISRATMPILISSEAFSSLERPAIEFIKERLKGHYIEILYVARDSASWHDSMARQQIKDFPFRTSMPAPFLGAPDAVMKQHTKPWIEAGLEPFFFDFNRRTIDNLLTHIGIDADRLSPVGEINASLPQPLLDLIMILNTIDMPGSHHGLVNRLIDRWWTEICRTNPKLKTFPEGLLTDTFNRAESREILYGDIGSRRFWSDLRSAVREAGHAKKYVDQNSAALPADVQALLTRLHRSSLTRSERLQVEAVITDWTRKQLETAL